MANTKSALKMIRVAERRRVRNKPVRTAAKSRVSKAERLIAQKDVQDAVVAVTKAVSVLDKAANKGVIHWKNAARRKPRLMKKLNLATA